MRIFIIKGETPELENYAPSIFYIGKDALYNTPEYPNGREIVLCESPAFGLMIREDMTINQVLAHVERMRKEGFTVTEKRIDY